MLDFAHVQKLKIQYTGRLKYSVNLSLHSRKTKDEWQKAKDLCPLTLDLRLLTLWQNILTLKQI